MVAVGDLLGLLVFGHAARVPALPQGIPADAGPAASIAAPVDYPVETFTDAERARLAPHFTNSTSPSSRSSNLPETVKGALFARYSRYPGTLRRLFLDEFADSLPARPARLGHGGEGERAAQLYERIFLGYGDDSVAQLGGAHVACEWVSNVLTKILQRPRLGAYLEQSTRYIAYDAPMDGDGRRYRYYRDDELGPEYERAMDDALRDLRGRAAARHARGRTSSTRAPTASRRPRTRARSRPRRSTCCAACCRPRRCRTWGSSRPARPTSS